MSEREESNWAAASLDERSEPFSAAHHEYQIRRTFRTLAGIYGREGARLRIIEIMEDETARRRN